MTATAEGDASDLRQARARARTTLERAALAMLSEAVAGELHGEALLGRVCRLVVESSSIAGASITCPHPDGTVELAGAHPAELGALVGQQFALREGPCFDCWSSTAPVVLYRAHERAATRWPRWGRVAAEQLPTGVSALRSDPISAGGAAVASLAVMGSASAVRTVDSATVSHLAQVAATHARTSHERGHYKTLASQLEHALASRVRIEQAKGALARHYGISVDAAFERLRWLARDQGRRLHQVAAEVVEELAGPDLPAGEPTLDGRAAAQPTLRVVRRPDGLRLRGAADVSAVPLLTSALAQLNRHGSIRIDLGDLEFLDAQCARILLRCAAHAAPGRELILTGARPIVAQVLRLLGVTDQPGIRLVAETKGPAHSP